MRLVRGSKHYTRTRTARTCATKNSAATALASAGTRLCAHTSCSTTVCTVSPPRPLQAVLQQPLRLEQVRRLKHL